MLVSNRLKRTHRFVSPSSLCVGLLRSDIWGVASDTVVVKGDGKVKFLFDFYYLFYYYFSKI